VRPTCPWSCAHVRVPWTQAGGHTERRYCDPSTLIGWRQLPNPWANPVTTRVDISAVGWVGGPTRVGSDPLVTLASRMAEAGAASTRAAPRQPLVAARSIAWRMGEAYAASTRAAPRQLKPAARSIARRMEEAGVANTRAAPSQSLELLAACTAGYVSSARSPTMRR
jgi:hypothetical protein